MRRERPGASHQARRPERPSPVVRGIGRLARAGPRLAEALHGVHVGTGSDDVAREVLAYFVNHPEAADTLEGVARWRLLEIAVTRKLEETERAVRWLVAEGYLLEESTGSAGRIFRLNRRTQSEALEFLAGRGRSEPERG